MSGTNPLPAGQAVYMPPLGAGTLAPGNSDGGFGGQGASNVRPLRGPPSAFVRQPYLGSPPAVNLATGFGAGSGAGIVNNGSDADQSQGLIAIKIGLNPAASGNIALTFPAGITAGQYVFLADAITGNPSPPAGNTVVVAWVNTRPLITGETIYVAYQWAVSQ